MPQKGHDFRPGVTNAGRHRRPGFQACVQHDSKGAPERYRSGEQCRRWRVVAAHYSVADAETDEGPFILSITSKFFDPKFTLTMSAGKAVPVI